MKIIKERWAILKRIGIAYHDINKSISFIWKIREEERRDEAVNNVAVSQMHGQVAPPSHQYGHLQFRLQHFQRTRNNDDF